MVKKLEWLEKYFDLISIVGFMLFIGGIYFFGKPPTNNTSKVEQKRYTITLGLRNEVLICPDGKTPISIIIETKPSWKAKKDSLAKNLLEANKKNHVIPLFFNSVAKRAIKIYQKMTPTQKRKHRLSLKNLYSKKELATKPMWLHLPWENFKEALKIKKKQWGFEGNHFLRSVNLRKEYIHLCKK